MIAAESIAAKTKPAVFICVPLDLGIRIRQPRGYGPQTADLRSREVPVIEVEDMRSEKVI